MRKRSLSVACERAAELDKISNKFEGVPSEPDPESEIEDDKDEVPDSDWTESDYKTLMDQLRSVLPQKDKTKYLSSLNKIDWNCVAFEGRTPEEVKEVTEALIRKIRKYRTLSEMIEDIAFLVKKRGTIKKPKQPLSAYNFYVKERYAQLKTKHPELQSPDLFKMLHKDYTALSEKKKKKFDAMAAEAKTVHKQQMEQYYRDHPEESKSKSKSKSKPKTRSKKNPTSKIITPFSLFQQDMRNESEELTLSEMRAKWNQLEVKKKLKYIQQAFKSQTENTTKVLKLTKEEQSMIEHAKGRPAPIPHSTCEYYLKHYAEPNPNFSLAEWRKLKIVEFKNLPKVRKLELEIENRQAKQDFVTNYENYISNITDEEQQRAEINRLKSFIKTKMDKDDRQQLPDESRTMMQTSQLENEMSDLPIAESTILKNKTKKGKNSALVQDSTKTDSSKPLKSILKSPAKKDAQTFAEPAVPKNKRKHSLNENDSDSNSEKKSKRSIARVPIVEPDLNSSKANGTTSSVGFTMLEPVRPATSILEYYMQHYYLGKAENCAESFKKLSSNRKELMREELRALQRKYFKDLQKYLKTVPPQDVKKYVRKAKQAKFDFHIEDDSLNESGLVEAKIVAKTTPKQEPQTSSSDSSDSEESSEEEKSKTGQNSGSVDDDSSDEE